MSVGLVVTHDEVVGCDNVVVVVNNKVEDVV